MHFKGDIIITDPCYITKDSKKDYDSMPDVKNYVQADFATDRKVWSEQYHTWEVAVDKWREENQDDWERCDYGENMEVLGLTTYLTSSTGYGDWSCHTFNSDTNEILGEFCADAGMVGVFLLDEVLKYNPDFDYHTERAWTTTLIKDFDGDIRIETVDISPESDDDDRDYDIEEDDDDDEDYEYGTSYDEVRVIGEGNINFYTTQTGL